MDLPTLNALLRVNGLTAQSAPENISDILLRSGYTEAEVAQAQEILRGAPAPTITAVPAAFVEPIIQNTRTFTHIDGRSSIFTGRLNVRQFWISMGVTFLLYCLLFIIVEISAVPIFAILSGVSLYAPPDLATGPLRSVLLFGIGMAMLILPALFFLIVSTGLQVRRCHDYGLSGSAWFMAMLALLVGGYLLYRLTPLAVVALALAIIAWLALVSWPGTKEENAHGMPDIYPTVWGAVRGCFDEEGNLPAFARQFLLPLAYLEITGIMLGVCINVVAPHVHIPDVRASASVSAPEAPNTIHI